MSALWFSRWWKHPVKSAKRSRPRRRVKPRLEALEDRCVPSIDMVTSLSGSATVAGSLPFEVANAASHDTIRFATNLDGGTITLGNTLDINNTLTIDGADNRITVNGGGLRVVMIEAGTSVIIDGLTITGGVSPPGLNGGGIYNKGILSLINSTVTGNSGGGSGGIYNASTGMMVMSGDTVNNNSATGSAGTGGGIGNVGTLEIINCTIAENTANQGGGIANIGALSVVNSTVAFNTVTGAGADGGGIDTFGGSDQLSLLNTVVYNPNSGAATDNEVLGTIAQAQALIYGPAPYKVAPGGDHGGSSLGGNPLLGPLQNNGGDTATMALLPGSPAIGHGATSSAIPGLAVTPVDQRGYPRPANSIDIGAVQTLTPQQRFVESLYLDFLHRTGDLSGQSDAGGWVTAVGQGMPAATVANAIARSPEALGVAVDGLYQRFLGRSADPAGRAGFVSYLQNGGTLEGATQLMLASPEYHSHFSSDSAFVQSLYQNVLQRTGSTPEAGGWVALLPQMGRAGVANAFLSSQEYRTVEVIDDYTKLLDRTKPPAAAEVNAWVGTGLDILSIDAFFAGSPEYQMNG
jgi:hypothetical protein